MLKDLRNLKQYDLGIRFAEAELEIVSQTHINQIVHLTQQINEVRKAMAEDKLVQQAANNLKALQEMWANAEELAKQAVVDYWQEFGFSTGKTPDVVEGCKLSIRETTTRQVVDPDTMVMAAREDGVYDKVIKELRPILNKAAFNSWVDLKSPPGVEVTENISATITILEKE